MYSRALGKQFSDDLSDILKQLEALEPPADQSKIMEALKHLVEMAWMEASERALGHNRDFKK